MTYINAILAADVSSAIMQSFQHLGYLPTEDQFTIVKEFLAGRDVLPIYHNSVSYFDSNHSFSN